MAVAANEYRTSSMSIAAVAEAVGYRSDAAFQRAFKHRMGMTPAQWRRTASVVEIPPRSMIRRLIDEKEFWAPASRAQ